MAFIAEEEEEYSSEWATAYIEDDDGNVKSFASTNHSTKNAIYDESSVGINEAPDFQQIGSKITKYFFQNSSNENIYDDNATIEICLPGIKKRISLNKEKNKKIQSICNLFFNGNSNYNLYPLKISGAECLINVDVGTYNHLLKFSSLNMDDNDNISIKISYHRIQNKILKFHI
eukprot:426048_1